MRYNHFDLLPMHAFRKEAGRMTLEGGGGGGGDGGAGEREAARQARIAAATDTINSIFNNQVKKSGQRWVDDTPRFMLFGGNGSGVDENGNPVQTGLGHWENYEYWADGDPNNSRSKLYADQKAAVYDLNTKEVNRQAAEAERVNRFGLARTGLLGGSADVDSVSELNRRTNEGLLRAGGIADQSAADLQAQDERTRANLISMAQSGIDTGSAASMALNGLSANANQAAQARSGATVGGLFDDLSQAYLTNQILTGRNAALTGYGQQNNVTATASPQTTYGGTVQGK